jgi:membrane fusion protein (multidrug efflux system)
MKKILLSSLVAAMLMYSCNSNTVDKKADLDKMKKEYLALGEKIKTIEAAMGNVNKPMAAKLVQYSAIANNIFSHYIDAQGTVEANNNVWVGTKMPGTTIINVLVHEGQQVREGQVLAEGETSAMSNQIAGMQSQLNLANTSYEKLNNLWKQNIGTEMQLLQAKAGKETLEKQIAALEAQKSMSKIVAPFAGVVDEVKIKAGEMISPFAPGIRLVNTSKLKIKSKMADAYINKVHTGSKVIINVPESNNTIEATVNYVSSVIDPISRTFNVEIAVGSSLLKPNMVAALKVNDLVKTNVIVISENLIQSSEQGDFVMIAKEENGKMVAHKVIVTKGESYNGNIIIENGLAVGDQIIHTGYQDLEEGQEVKQ